MISHKANSNAVFLTVIVPVLNESLHIRTTLMALVELRQRGVEVLVVDGGSSDETVLCALPLADDVIEASVGRARQMNAAAAVAQGSVLLFLHADTLLPLRADELIREAILSGRQWGRFDVRITGKHPMLKIIAIMMNLRSRLSGIATGDQAIFVKREVFDRVGGFPDQALMEDIEISRRLKAIGSPACLRQRVCTSGRRWESRGIWRTMVLMWSLRWRYWRGASADCLAKSYR
jgi:rSAM/selenodomain-associated transferase 2